MDPVPICNDKEALIAYLYDESEPVERERVEAHLASCERCLEELTSLRGVRGTLETWSPPESNLGFHLVSDRSAERQPWWRWRFPPAGTLAAAAAIVLVVAAAVASVEVRYDNDGLVFRMGWVDRASDRASVLATPVEVDTGAPPAWRADLVALENQLRSELAVPANETASAAEAVRVAARPDAESPDSGVGRAPAEAELIRQLQTLITQSEGRQRQERALWLTEFTRELDMQRLADQRRLQQELGAFEAGVNEFLVRVSDR